MHKLTLPIQLEDLNLLMAATDDKQDQLLSICVTGLLIDKVVKWMNELLPTYSRLFDDEEETAKLNDIVITTLGLWQLRVLANYGSDYTKSLRSVLVDDGDKNDVLLLARRVSEHLPQNDAGTKVDVILGNASGLITTSSWQLKFLVSDLNPSRYPDQHSVNHITYSLLSILATMCYRIIEELTAKPEVDPFIMDELSRVSELTKSDFSCDFEPLLFLCNLVDVNFKANIKAQRKDKIKSLNLRVI